MLGPKAEVTALLVNGEVRVRHGLITAKSHEDIAAEAARASKRLLSSAQKAG